MRFRDELDHYAERLRDVAEEFHTLVGEDATWKHENARERGEWLIAKADRVLLDLAELTRKLGRPKKFTGHMPRGKDQAGD